jgi:hypothetical protein
MTGKCRKKVKPFLFVKYTGDNLNEVVGFLKQKELSYFDSFPLVKFSEAHEHEEIFEKFQELVSKNSYQAKHIHENDIVYVAHHELQVLKVGSYIVFYPEQEAHWGYSNNYEFYSEENFNENFEEVE